MKTKLLFLAMAVFSLASCQKEIIDNSSNQGKVNDEYYIEIQGMDGTKSNPSTVSLNLANLSYASSKTVTAQLKKKSGTSWTNITSGVTYSWSANSTDSQKFSGSGTVNASCTVGAKATGSGTIKVSANYGGSVVATQDVPVTVSDDRALSWSNATTPITSGEVYSAVLNSNFSCTATVSSNNTSFLVGTTSSNLSKSTSVTFDSNKTKTIYYKYTGSNETTVKIEAKNTESQKSTSLEISTAKKQGTICAYGEQEISPDAYYHPDYPAGTYMVYLSADNSIKIYEEAHEFDLQYETTPCHSSCCYKFGYEDDNGVFHEFTNYSIYKDSSLKTLVNLNHLASIALSSSTWTDDELNWIGSTNKNCTVYISVKDSGYEGVYKGLCYKYNYL